MKKIAWLFGIIILSGFTSCLSVKGTFIEVPDKKLEISDGVTIQIDSIRSGLNSVRSNGKQFSPIINSSKICQFDIKIINESNTDYIYSNLQSVELLVVDSSGETKYLPWTKPFDASNFSIDFSDNGKTDKEVAKINSDSIKNDTLYFIYPEDFEPAAIVNNRFASVILLSEDHPGYSDVQNALAQSIALENALKLVIGGGAYEDVEEMLENGGSTLDAVNNKGINILFQGIMSHNESVVAGAIKNGADLHAQAKLNFHTVEPMHIAVLGLNRFAIEELIKAGVSIESTENGIDEPAVLAIRLNNVPAVKMLAEMGVPVSEKKISMTWSPAISGIKYAKDRNYLEMVKLLENEN